MARKDADSPGIGGTLVYWRDGGLQRTLSLDRMDVVDGEDGGVIRLPVVHKTA